MNKKKEIVWSLVTVVLAGLTVWTVVSRTNNFSVQKFIEYIVSTNPLWIIGALMLMLGYIIFEGAAVLTICKGFGHKRKAIDGFLYSSADIYFSAITPSATGGQPACAYFMMVDGIPTAVTTVALLLNLVMYTAATITIGLFALIVRPGLFQNFNSFSKTLIYLGYLILTVVGVFFILLIKNEAILNGICNWGINFLTKIKILKHPQKHRDKLAKVIEEYKECSALLGDRKLMMLKVLILNLSQRVCQVLIPAAVFLSMGGTGEGAFDVFATQIFVTIGSNCMPVPGAVGVSDYLLLDGLRDTMSEVVATNMELLSRSISFYLSVFFCLVVVLIGHFKRKIKNK